MNTSRIVQYRADTATSGAAQVNPSVALDGKELMQNPRPVEASEVPASLRVVHIPRRFVRTPWGGTETVVLETSRCLRELGHRPEIVTSRALSACGEEEIASVRVRRFGHFYPYLGLDAARSQQLDLKGGNLFSFSMLWHLLTRERPDLIHLHTGKRLGGIARWAARRRGVPYVVTLHGGMYDVPAAERESLAEPSRGTVEWGKALGWWVGSRKVLADAAAIVCVGRAEFDEVRERHPGQRVVYLPNGVHAERFAGGDGSAFRREHGIAPADRVILCVGRIDPQKNQRQLIRLLPAVRASVPRARLVLVGAATDLAYAAGLNTLARELRVAPFVTLVPGLEPGSQRLLDAYQAADAFVLPSLHEPFGIVVIEAWAAGRPVVASRVGGVPGFAEHGCDALLVEPGSDDDMCASIVALLTDPERSARLARAGTRKARADFDWATCTRRLVELYREVILENSLRQ